MCPDCHWLIENAKHADVHPRMLRYYYTVSLLWLSAGIAAMAAGQVITMIHVTNYSPAEEAIRWWIEIDLG